MDDPLSIKILISRRNKSPCLRVCSSSGRDWRSSVVGPSGLVTCSKKKKCLSPCLHVPMLWTTWQWGGQNDYHEPAQKVGEWEACSLQWFKGILKSSWTPGYRSVVTLVRRRKSGVQCEQRQDKLSPLALLQVWNSLWPQCLSEGNELRCRDTVITCLWGGKYAN